MAATVLWSLIAVGILCGLALSAAGAVGLFLLSAAVGSVRLRRCGMTVWRYAVPLWTLVILAHVAVAAVGLLSLLISVVF